MNLTRAQKERNKNGQCMIWKVNKQKRKQEREKINRSQTVGNGTGASSLEIWTGVDYPVGTITAIFSCLGVWNKNDKTALSEPTDAEPKLVIPACETKSVLKIAINCISGWGQWPHGTCGWVYFLSYWTKVDDNPSFTTLHVQVSATATSTNSALVYVVLAGSFTEMFVIHFYLLHPFSKAMIYTYALMTTESGSSG